MATGYTGVCAELGLGVESTWGTAVTPTNWYRLLPGASLRRVRPRSRRNVFQKSGTIPVVTGHFTERDGVEGGWGTELLYPTAGLLLEAILGANATTGVGPYVHSNTLAATVLPLTHELHRSDNSSETFEGVYLNDWTLSIEAGGGPMVLSIGSVVGQTTDGTRPTPPNTATHTTQDEPILPQHASDFSWNGDTYCIRSLSISNGNNLAERPCLGSLVTENPTRSGPMEPTMSVNVEVRDASYLAWLSEATGDATITFTGGGNNSLAITAHNATLTDVSDPIADQGIILQSLVFALRGDGTDHGLKLDLQNDESSNRSNG